jgi:hypothetical protein
LCAAVTGACCSHDLIHPCTDGVTQAECDCPDCEWVELAACPELDCEATAIPTVDEWGLVVLALALMVGAKLFSQRRAERLGR